MGACLQLGLGGVLTSRCLCGTHGSLRAPAAPHPAGGVTRDALDARRAWGGGPRGHGGGPVLGHEGAFAAQDFFAFQAAPARVGASCAVSGPGRVAV